MPTSGEHKTVQARILAYAEAEGALLGQFRHFINKVITLILFVLYLYHHPDSNFRLCVKSLIKK